MIISAFQHYLLLRFFERATCDHPNISSYAWCTYICPEVLAEATLAVHSITLYLILVRGTRCTMEELLHSISYVDELEFMCASPCVCARACVCLRLFSDPPRPSPALPVRHDCEKSLLLLLSRISRTRTHSIRSTQLRGYHTR